MQEADYESKKKKKKELVMDMCGMPISARLMPANFVRPGECIFHRDHITRQGCPGSVCDYPNCVPIPYIPQPKGFEDAPRAEVIKDKRHPWHVFKVWTWR